MSKSLRIRTTPGGDDKYVKLSLEQDFDFIEILSLKLTQEEVYNRFCSDYGVVVGRVIVNNGFGVPNAKVSIFIPIDDEDKGNPEKFSLYPYTLPSDKNSDGLRYNLLPKDIVRECHNPVGSFPKKREVLDNDVVLEIYEKYYKFTTTTNESGDYMLFGVPIGNHTVHVDVDLSDMGIISQRPYDFISKGYNGDQFESPTKFNSSTNIDTLSHIKSQDVGANVVSFWGDEDNCQIGITRIDVDLKYNVTPTAIFMGSIFGDNEKNSVNKNCQPRKKLGVINEQTTGEGTIEMIRKRYDGRIERFDVDGGRVINDEGVWAYQIPMNLDYVVTNEFGKLIPSNDPNKGIPTKSLCRFRAGLDQTGGEGRLRTRAKFLIPHNPDTFEDSDYDFGENTKDESFAQLNWNKLYTVKSFIPRVQPSSRKDDKRFIGLKLLDDVGGDTTPFPFNRLDTDLNPLFIILCILITIIVTIITLINTVIISLMNTVIRIINVVLTAICGIMSFIGGIACTARYLFNSRKRKACNARIKNVCQDIPYIKCISLECDDQRYAPGCLGSGKGLEELQREFPDTHYANDGHENHGLDAGYLNCITLVLADALNAFSFEFYNDWINGSLYAFLLKYKKRKRGKEKFCEYDCNDFVGGTYGDGNPDNKCYTNYIVERCMSGGNANAVAVVGIKDGIVKTYEDELYYPPITHEGGFKMFATDIVNLGAVLECDINNVPVIHNELISTTYNLPPLTNEFVDDVIAVSGMDSPGLDDDDSLLFNISCLGAATNAQNCVNIRRLCEFGIELDEDRTGEILNDCCNSFEIDRKIDNCEVEGTFVRNTFGWLNNDSITSLYDSNMSFPDSNFPADTCNSGNTYNNFRGFTNINVNQAIGNSFYFYFGLRNGKTALDLAKSKYFTTCDSFEVSELIILGTVTDVTTLGGSDGTISITVEGGSGVYTYSWTGPSGFTSVSEDLTNLIEGTYNVIVTDSENNQASRTFIVYGPLALNCFVTTVPETIVGSSDGEIILNNVMGGTQPYSFGLFSLPTNTLLFGQSGLTQPVSLSVTGLTGGDYRYVVTDSDLTICSGDTEITQPSPLVVNIDTSGLTCFDNNSGIINLNITSGNPPYVIQIEDSSSNIISNTFINQTLSADTFEVNVFDVLGQTFNQSVIVNQPNLLEIVTATTFNVSCFGLSDGSVSSLIVTGGTAPYTYSWSDADGVISTSNNISGLPAGEYEINVEDVNGCTDNSVFYVTEPNELQLILGGAVSPVNGGDGRITVFTAGGNGGNEYEIISGPTINTTGQFSGQFIDLSGGTYQIQVTDINGCTDILDDLVTI